ncbi:3'-5' exonuclease [Alistipes sp. OttesenSCG-928-B03]|nr:3'-5' exonuclease [Alistipes sp. OttesenSCG-928-B03]
MAAPTVEQKIYTGIVLDFETGGLDATRCACTQIALQSVRFDTWEVIDRYKSYIRPYNKQDIGQQRRKVLKDKREIEQEREGVLMDYEAVALNYSGITMEQLYKNGHDLAEVADDVLRFAERAALSKGAQCKPLLIGQNITFDVTFLQQLMNYTGKTKEFEKAFAGRKDFYGNFQPHYMDTISLARFAMAHDPQMTSYKLELICERLGISLDDAHDADADVTATLNVAKLLSSRMRNQSGGDGAILTEGGKTRTHFLI